MYVTLPKNWLILSVQKNSFFTGPPDQPTGELDKELLQSCIVIEQKKMVANEKLKFM